MKALFPQFDVEYISGVMSLRKPQKTSLKRLADVIAKKIRGIQYCQAATDWGKANGYKAWQYLFIPSQQITQTSTFNNLSQRFTESMAHTSVDKQQDFPDL